MGCGKQDRRAQLAKIDIKIAYRNVPVHTDDRWLLGMNWRGVLFVALLGSDECRVAVEKVLHMFDELGFPLEEPETRVTFLGFELDTMTMEVRLPQQKLRELRQLSYQWRSQKACLRIDLESLVGKLAHATQAVGEDVPEKDVRAAGCEG